MADPRDGWAARVGAERCDVRGVDRKGDHAPLAHEPRAPHDQRARARPERRAMILGVEVPVGASDPVRRGEPRDDGRRGDSGNGRLR